ncbi:MAG: hypothetical protein JO356_18020 [Acidobacteria bacterium]|nr:hypothetical protein [Acidobacteriota bacterium]
MPAAETLGVLVYLAENNQALSGSARRMLETWDEGSSKAVAGDPKTPKEILDYWLKPENIRPALLPILAENPSVELSKLSQLADQLTGDAREVLANSRRLKASRLSSENPTHQAQAEAATPNASEGSADTSLGVPGSRAETVAHENSETLAGKEPEVSEADGEAEKVLISFSTEHAAEIASQEEKPFQPLGGLSEPLPLEAGAQAAAAAAVSGAAPSPAPARAAMVKKPANVEDERRGSVLQKIAKLDIKGRIQLAIKGTKEERSLLVRDGTKIVALAVLESPKITDSEVEKFATQKNVLEALLRAIPLRRRFAKNYAIVRNLAFNPRTPIDVSLGLIKNLLLADLKNLSGNKEVSDTIRKLALRMFKQKQQASKKD